MESHLNQKTFSERVREKTEAERKEIEDLVKIELERLATSLRKESASVLTTTRADMERQAEALVLATKIVIQEQTAQVEALKRRWRMAAFIPLVVGSSLFLGISLGSWGLMRYQAAEIIRQQQVLADLEAKGGKTMVTVCGEARRLCVQVDSTAPEYMGGYRILKGY